MRAWLHGRADPTPPDPPPAPPQFDSDGRFGTTGPNPSVDVSCFRGEDAWLRAGSVLDAALPQLRPGLAGGVLTGSVAGAVGLVGNATAATYYCAREYAVDGTVHSKTSVGEGARARAGGGAGTAPEAAPRAGAGPACAGRGDDPQSWPSPARASGAGKRCLPLAAAPRLAPPARANTHNPPAGEPGIVACAAVCDLAGAQCAAHMTGANGTCTVFSRYALNTSRPDADADALCFRTAKEWDEFGRGERGSYCLKRYEIAGVRGVRGSPIARRGAAPPALLGPSAGRVGSVTGGLGLAGSMGRAPWHASCST